MLTSTLATASKLFSTCRLGNRQFLKQTNTRTEVEVSASLYMLGETFPVYRPISATATETLPAVSSVVICFFFEPSVEGTGCREGNLIFVFSLKGGAETKNSTQ